MAASTVGVCPEHNFDPIFHVRLSNQNDWQENTICAWCRKGGMQWSADHATSCRYRDNFYNIHDIDEQDHWLQWNCDFVKGQMWRAKLKEMCKTRFQAVAAEVHTAQPLALATTQDHPLPLVLSAAPGEPQPPPPPPGVVHDGVHNVQHLSLADIPAAMHDPTVVTPWPPALAPDARPSLTASKVGPCYAPPIPQQSLSMPAPPQLTVAPKEHVEEMHVEILQLILQNQQLI